jgi:hypothetical protein
MMDISKNNMVTLAHVRVTGRDYYIHISYCMTSQQVHIFKYNQHRCGYGVFVSEADACEFIALAP